MSDPIIDEFPALRDVPIHSAKWYRLWRFLHNEKYPNADRVTRRNLDELVARAEMREACERAKHRIAAMPAWKQNVLWISAQPTLSEPRKPVVRD